MRILFLTAEAAPFVTVGGLSQVMRFLPAALQKRGNDCRIFTPYFGSTNDEILQKKWKKRGQGRILKIPAFTAGATRTEPKPGETAIDEVECGVVDYDSKKGDPGVTFLQNREYFELRKNVFGYADDHMRFTLLSRGCLEWLRDQCEKIKAGHDDIWWPDVIHCQDWHAGYFVELARRDPRYSKLLKDVAVVFTVHNFRYQANGDLRYLADKDFDDGVAPLAALDDPRLLRQNALKRGLLYADAITTVSPTHAIEVLTQDYAEGLLDTVTQVRGKLSGILNGVDNEELDPATDVNIKKNYGRRWWQQARRVNKADLQKQFALPVDPSKPILGYVGRLAQQKGLELMMESVSKLMRHNKDVQLVVVGGGEDRYRKELEDLKALYPERVGLHLLSDFALPRKVFAGADLVLIPSLFEPGGIVALEALRYGAVPLVRRTGGMNDSMVDFDPDTREGNGFSFVEKDGWAMFAALVEALTVYKQPQLWAKLVENALDCDFSWDHAAEEYDLWYERAVAAHREKGASKKRNLFTMIKQTL